MPSEPHTTGSVFWSDPIVPEEQENLGFVGSLGPAFRLENEVVSMFRAAQAPRFEDDFDFDLRTELTRSPLAANHSRDFVGVGSKKEFDYRARIIEQENADKQHLSASGVPGMLAAMVAGVVSPTSLIPLVGPARGVKGVAQAFGLAGGAVTAQELLLQGTQATRTAEEGAISIAGGTVLAGLLGSAAVMLRREDFNRIAAGIDNSPGELTIHPLAPLGSAKPAGAQIAIGESAGRLKQGPGVDTVAKIGPVTRTINDENQAASHFMAQMASGGTTLERNIEGVATARGGTVEARIKGWADPLARSLDSLEERFADYWLGTDVQVARQTRARMGSFFTRGGTKLNFDEFKQEVARTMFSADKHEVPEVQAAAAFFRKELYDPMLKEAQSVGLLPDEIDLKGAESYLNRLYDINNIVGRPEVFIQKLAAHIEEKLSTKARERLLKVKERNAQAIQDVEDLTRSSEETAKFREEVEAELAAMEANPLSALADELAESKRLSRAQQKATKATATEAAEASRASGEPGQRTSPGQELSASMQDRSPEEVLAEGGEPLTKYLDDKRKLRRRLRNLSRSYVGREAKQRRALERIERIEEQNLSALRRVGNKALTIQKKLNKLTDRQLDAELSRLRGEFMELDELMQRMDERLAKFGNDFEEGVLDSRQRRVSGKQRETLTEEIKESFRSTAIPISPTEALFDHGYQVDNPGGNWVARKQARADEAIAEGESSTASGKGITGSITATVGAGKNALQLPTRVLRGLRGANDELPAPGNPKYDNLIESVRKDKFDPDQKGNRVVIAVNHKGEAFVLEGNNRVAVARDLGIDNVKAEIRYWNGGEGAAGDWAPAAVAEKYLPKTRGGGKISAPVRKAVEKAVDDAAAGRVANPPSGAKSSAAYTQAYDAFVARKGELADETATAREATTGIADHGNQAEIAQELRGGRLSDIADKIEDARTFDRAAAREAVDEAYQKVLETVNRVNSKRALREEKLRQRADKLDPVRVADEVTDIQTRAAKRQERFTESIRTKADDFDLETGNMNFTRHAREIAEELKDRIVGQDRRIVGLDILIGERGPELARLLDIDEREFSDFLIHDMEHLARAYSRTMGADIEMTRTFGTPNGVEAWRQLEDSFKAEVEQLVNKHGQQGHVVIDKLVKGEPLGDLEKTLDTKMVGAFRKLHKRQKNIREDLAVVIDRLRHRRGIPENSDGAMYRMGKAALALNTLRLMGAVVVASVPDMARPVMKYGLVNTFRDGFVPMVTNFKQWKMTAAEAKAAGVGLDTILASRAASIFDIFDDVGRGSSGERMLQFAANNFGNIAGFNQWTSAMKQFTGVVVHGQLYRSMRTLLEDANASPKAQANATEFLASLGIDDSNIRLIWDQLHTHQGGDEVGGVRWPNTADWTDPVAKRTYRAAMAQAIDDTIVTPGAERPNWIDHNVGLRLVAQFRSFAFSSTTKTMLAGLQQRDMALVNGMWSSLALGTVSYYLWAVATGGDAYEEMLKAGPDKWADEAIDRSGLLAVLGEVRRIGERVPLTQNVMSFSGERTTRRQGADIVDAVLGPSAGLAKTAGSIIMGLDDPTQSTLHQLRTLTPFQNVFYLRQVLDAVERGVAEGINLPETRQ